MASEQQKQMNALYASIKERLSNPDIDLATASGHCGELSFGRDGTRGGHIR
jgi:hypothetical protein